MYEASEHSFRDAFEASVASSEHLEPVDAALVEAGRKIVDRVDQAVATGNGQEITTAHVLVPHVLNVLREALATPASRKAAGVGVKEVAGGKLAQLRAVNGRK